VVEDNSMKSGSIAEQGIVWFVLGLVDTAAGGGRQAG
jgi:hypothetical protein